MINRIKIFCFNYEEYKPTDEGFYIYKNKKYTNKEFMFMLKKNRIWFNSYFKEVLK